MLQYFAVLIMFFFSFFTRCGSKIGEPSGESRRNCEKSAEKMAKNHPVAAANRIRRATLYWQWCRHPFLLPWPRRKWRCTQAQGCPKKTGGTIASHYYVRRPRNMSKDLAFWACSWTQKSSLQTAFSSANRVKLKLTQIIIR